MKQPQPSTITRRVRRSLAATALASAAVIFPASAETILASSFTGVDKTDSATPHTATNITWDTVTGIFEPAGELAFIDPLNGTDVFGFHNKAADEIDVKYNMTSNGPWQTSITLDLEGLTSSIQLTSMQIGLRLTNNSGDNNTTGNKSGKTTVELVGSVSGSLGVVDPGNSGYPSVEYVRTLDLSTLPALDVSESYTLLITTSGTGWGHHKSLQSLALKGDVTTGDPVPGSMAPAYGAVVPAGNVELSWTNLPPDTGSDVWMDVWFGTDPRNLDQVAAEQPNLESFTVNAPVADQYFWRVDSYLDGSPAGTPLTGTVFFFEVNDSDGDGMPDWYELLYTNPPSPTGLNPGDDLDLDGLTNLQEFQLGTSPIDPDSDHDGLLDGDSITVSTGDSRYEDWAAAGIVFTQVGNDRTFRGENEMGTDPTNPDTDGDGLLDGVETHTGVFVSKSDTGTNPLSPDTDGDSAGDWYEVYASFTDPTDPADKPGVPYPLPAHNGAPGASDKPVKVYILSGQSNMVGFGRVADAGKGTLSTITRTENKFPNLIDAEGEFIARQDVWYRGVISAIGNGPLEPGFGANGNSFGPELGFGQLMGWYHDEPVLIIKASIGNRGLQWDILPAGTPSRDWTDGRTYAGYGQSPTSWPTGTTPNPINWYAGKEFDRFFLAKEDWAPAGADDDTVGTGWILDNWATEYAAPGKPFEGQDFEIAGFGWFHGFDDQNRGDPFTGWYEENLVNLINTLRNYYEDRYPGQVVPDAPFAIASYAVGGFGQGTNANRVAQAQLNVSGETGNYPAFAGNVKTMDARDYWRSTEQSPSTDGIHYNHNAETMMLVGDALGRAMVGMLEAGGTTPGDDYAAWATLFPGADLTDPSADLDGDGLTNDEERVFGLDPTRGDSVNPISLPLDAAAGTLTYTRRNPALTGAGFSYEWSSTLADGSWTPFTPASKISNGGDPVEAVTITLDATLLDEPRLFVRVLATFD